MGVLNVTPDSFSDGGNHIELDAALEQAKFMAANGADIIDVGGESTRPGALTISVAEEIKRIEPVINQISAQSRIPISVDTRKCKVAAAAYTAGASMVNDVSGFTFDPELLPYCSEKKIPVCVMQSRDRIIADIGVGFGKSVKHNLTLIKNISFFHGLGVPLLLGVSRKSIIDKVAKVENPKDRIHGSISLAICALAQGVQLFRVHDVAETKQAFDLWMAVNFGE